MIKIHSSKSADSRTATSKIDKQTLEASSRQHIGDVFKAISWMRNNLHERALFHDFTKLINIDEFYSDFERKQNGDKGDFREWHWYHDIHTVQERHHLDYKPPEDINLFDVMEHVADIVMAGMARSGSVYDSTIDPDIIYKAFQNTIRMLKDEVQVVAEDDC